MSTLDLFFRSGNIVLLTLLAMVLIKDYHTKPSAVLGAIVALGAAASGTFALTSQWEWLVLEIPLNLISGAGIVAFWLLSKSLFEDSFQWKWSYLLLYVLYVAVGWFGHYITFEDHRGLVHWAMRSELTHNGVALIPSISWGVLLVVLALYHALKDWRVDLVESRRRARMVSVLLGGIIILVITCVEVITLGTPRSIHVDTMISGFFFLLIIGIYTRFLGFRRVYPAQQIPFELPTQTLEDAEAEDDEVQGVEIVGELERMMVEEKIYCEEGLTIRRLAEVLHVKEYRLRRAINGHLGYRNFNHFLNLYRIGEAARQLVVPETRHLPVLSIALDVGYRSLSPFNKAFKEIKGMTPTEYRSHNKPSVLASDQIHHKMVGDKTQTPTQNNT
ncbi:MAG: helix-turn-helix domain-containing protein [Candidatus Thiodiazotropha sp. (ex Codakia rugifera)]|nr:helix-turn-helix domain-containing protein [Candidatus Thiodiazotropha sp. (ex Codakia rugifera)]